MTKLANLRESMLSDVREHLNRRDLSYPEVAKDLDISIQTLYRINWGKPVSDKVIDDLHAYFEEN